MNGPATLRSNLFNISDDMSCDIDRVMNDASALFASGTLENNGGLAQTLALSGTSVAIDTGIPVGGNRCRANSVDQLGEPIVGNCDVGSYELQPSPTDGDKDEVPDVMDNCPAVANGDQDDNDLDGQGDACDDDDNVGQSDANETQCGSDPRVASSLSADADGDGIPDCADVDFVSPTQPVTVYQDVNFGGNSLSVGMGDVTIRELRNSSVGNDRISSISVAPGFEVLACKHGWLRGRCEIFTENTPDLRSINFNDVISSLEVRAISQ